jgi:hypothetical protein
VYPGVPLETVTVAVPVLPPLQRTLVVEVNALIAVGWVTVVVAVAVHPLESVTVAVYVPAASPVAVAAVPPLGAQLYV